MDIITGTPRGLPWRRFRRIYVRHRGRRLTCLPKKPSLPVLQHPGPCHRGRQFGTVLIMLEESTQLRDHLEETTAYYRKQLTDKSVEF